MVETTVEDELRKKIDALEYALDTLLDNGKAGTGIQHVLVPKLVWKNISDWRTRNKNV